MRISKKTLYKLTLCQAVPKAIGYQSLFRRVFRQYTAFDKLRLTCFFEIPLFKTLLPHLLSVLWTPYPHQLVRR